MLTCKLEIVKFSKKFIKPFLNNREICRREPNCIQNGKKSSRTWANQISLPRNRLKQSPSFFLQSVRRSQTTMR